MTHEFVNTDNPNSNPNGNYAGVISQIAKEGICPFCPEHLNKYHKKPITENRHWLVTDNMYPYKPSRIHKLLIHKGHISHISEISVEAWAELHAILRNITIDDSVTGGTFMMRFGDTKYTGASVTHLHAHIIQSDPDHADYEKSKGLVIRIG